MGTVNWNPSWLCVRTTLVLLEMCECLSPTPNEFSRTGSAATTRVLLKIFLSCSIVKVCRGPLKQAEASQRSTHICVNAHVHMYDAMCHVDKQPCACILSCICTQSCACMLSCVMYMQSCSCMLSSECTQFYACIQPFQCICIHVHF